jgi:hypothetical protein
MLVRFTHREKAALAGALAVLIPLYSKLLGCGLYRAADEKPIYRSLLLAAQELVTRPPRPRFNVALRARISGQYLHNLADLDLFEHFGDFNEQHRA